MGGNGDAIRVQLLGPVQAWRGENELELGGPRRRAVFSMLAMRANQPVSRSQLIDGLWGEDPPISAVNSMHVHVAGLRRVLEPRRAHRAPGQVLPASGPGYLLRLEPGRLDAEALNQHLAQARRAPGASGPDRDLEAAFRSLEAALELWQGVPLSGIPGPWADAERLRLEELRLGTIEQSVDAMLALGRHRQVVAQLTSLIREHPLRERFREQLMLALYRSGRQAGALTEYAAARRLLDAELGVEPGAGLQRLHHQILNGDAALNLPTPPAASGRPDPGGPGTASGTPTPVPRELPADVPAFTGRAAERVQADLTSAATLAAQCARLPLALRVAAEFAVSRPALTLAQLAAELAAEQRRLDMLDAGGDPRTAIRAVFSWSYRHLPPAAARAFRLAGLHPAPDLGLGAAAALFDTSAGQAGELLNQLHRAHLVHLCGAARYGMHDLLRAYAAYLTNAPQERTEALTRLLDYYLAASASAMDVLFPAERHRRPRIPRLPPAGPPLSGPAAARTWLDNERTAVQAVVSHAAGHGWPRHAVLLSALVSRHLETGGHYTEAVTIHTHARRAARQAGDRGGEAHALNNLGIVSGRLGRYEEAACYLRRSLALFRETGDHVGAARALGNLGSGDWRQGRYQQAARYHQESLALFREIGDELGEARALNSLGLVSLWMGEYRPAVGYFRQSLDLYSRLGDQANEAHARGNLGLAYLRLGCQQEAGTHLVLALALSRGIGDRSGEASALTDLGALACTQGQYQEAASRHRQALALFREIGERTGQAEALNGLGEVLLATGRPAVARERHLTALALAIEVGDPHEQSRAHRGADAASARAVALVPARPAGHPY